MLININIPGATLQFGKDLILFQIPTEFILMDLYNLILNNFLLFSDGLIAP